MNNQTNTIVNLSHLILNKITNLIDDNIDKICFSLVCKRWFDDRDKYLIFNTDNIYISSVNSIEIKDFKNNQYFRLKSYENIFHKSIESKNDCVLIIAKNKFNLITFWEMQRTQNFIYYEDKIREIEYFPSYITKIDIKTDFFDEEDLIHFYRALNKSQSVTELNRCGTLKYGLPQSIRKLSLASYFNDELVKGCLPANLVTLEFGTYFNKQIKHGILPESLVILKYGWVYKISPEIGVLPASLKVLSISSEMPLKVGSLPHSLEKLTLSEHRILPIEDPGVLPQSLKILKGIPHSWLPVLHLPNLHSLSVTNQNLNDSGTINFDQLPSNNLKTFKMERAYLLTGTVPTSITNLVLRKSKLDFDKLFPKTLQYHFERFECSIDPSQIPNNISIDRLVVELKEPVTSIPHQIQSVSFNTESWFYTKLIECRIPRTVTELKIPFKNTKLPIEAIILSQLPKYSIIQSFYTIQLPIQETKLAMFFIKSRTFLLKKIKDCYINL
ncbi:hypothetical protein PPL_10922 [Heterostelium album PN500]|uniref:COI1 F-box domain-containing protein n=1 Tax=Heterostelium pallidum (strain ATCC 26659 / Pp 5 / PN500) TaxID=670386 RepID=D3BSF5_HETP5|nr:hypothetical protein PPL_10922 [Heterostelium album PN500]EFA75661.1 hypothetical protein PPL_10922 [Heterostelium album PN500]|eukprot:XP_020427795.1 hypothetical protein PPL_10922 [Heterostelium album PN500]